MKFILSILFLIFMFFVALIVLLCGGSWLLVLEIVGFVVIAIWLLSFLAGVLLVGFVSGHVISAYLRRKG